MSRADAGLRNLTQRWLPRPTWLWTPMETGGTVSGVPDSHWAHEGSRTSGWIEHKATTGWAVEIRPHQIAWLRMHSRAGVRCHIAVRASGAGSSASHGDALWLLRGSAAGEVAELGLRCPEELVLGRWYGSPDKWDWAEVSRLLRA